MKKRIAYAAGAALLSLPLMLVGCGEGAGEGAGDGERGTRYEPETTREAPGAIGRPDATEGDGEAPPAEGG